MASPRFPLLLRAMHQAAQIVHDQWSAMAGRMLTPAERQVYLSGLRPGTVVETPTGYAAVITNTWPPSGTIEAGHGPYHLPSRINWALAKGVRRSRTGRLYLIVPFRHYSAQRGSRAQAGTPASRRNMLPRSIYNLARSLRPEQYLTAGPSGGRAVHAPGLQPYVPRFAPNVRPGYVHAAIQERLQRVPAARRGSGQYLTFRTLAQDSPGWWIPAKPPRRVADATVQASTSEVRQALEAAALEDLRVDIRSTLGGGTPS